MELGAGLAIDDRELPTRKLSSSRAVAVNLGVLGYFKYFNFFVARSTTRSPVGLDLAALATSIVLPVGISFFTFQRSAT